MDIGTKLFYGSTETLEGYDPSRSGKTLLAYRKGYLDALEDIGIGIELPGYPFKWQLRELKEKEDKIRRLIETDEIIETAKGIRNLVETGNLVFKNETKDDRNLVENGKLVFRRIASLHENENENESEPLPRIKYRKIKPQSSKPMNAVKRTVAQSNKE